MELVWDASSRLLVQHYARDSRATREQGLALVALLDEVLADDVRPFGVLGDARHMVGVDEGYRAATSACFRRRRDACVIAVYNLGPVLRVITEMFRIGTGTQLKAFATEPEARAWLRTRGITA